MPDSATRWPVTRQTSPCGPHPFQPGLRNRSVSWCCADCGRSYDDPPETCACGSAAVEPDDGSADGEAEDRFSLLAVRRRLLEPGTADRSLVSDDPRIALAFRVLLALSLAVLGLLVLLSLV